MNERGLKNVDIARMLGVKPPRISNLLSGEAKKGSRNIGQDTIDRLCKELDIDEVEFYRYDTEDHDNISIKKPAPHILQQMLDVQYIMENGDPIITLALSQNITAFKASVEMAKKADDKISELKQEIASLKKDGCAGLITVPPIPTHGQSDVAVAKVVNGGSE